MTAKTLSDVNKNLLILHFTVFIWGFTGILGALISIGAVQMVWYRVMIASITLFIYFKVSGLNLKVSTAQFLQFFFTGAIVALHWILFFGAIKASTVSVTLVCLSSFTLFTAVLEPLIKKTALQAGDIFIGLVIICGIYLIFKFESHYTSGIILGLSAAGAASLFSIINSNFAKKSDARVIGFYELSGAFFWITVYRLLDKSLLQEHFNLSVSDWIYLFILGTICTALAYIAGVSVMRTLSAFRVALISNLEPVYGIILAFIFFGHKETMSAGFYMGSALILGAVFLYPIYKKRRSKA
ncbi:EamA-like transporter family protein [Pedobacter westerhofensis]|uniref:EamA-like transporter family protein n=1 Tax=Pedobacter westerhofensis TaxID=425512 RepID=A0A521EX15_9SPHI|nr:DMT family transporter [Pedobacter westerhofensis]SMO88478.1 EamA-like transporter family protein [Pedobacter westerhofensis]